MYALLAVKQQLLKELKKAVGKGFTPAITDLETPPNPELGELAFPCFTLAKKTGRNPVELARELAEKIKPKENIKTVRAQGPYVNFFLDYRQFGREVLKEIGQDGEKYGMSETGAKKKVLVEYANPNTHKDIHVGHLRNFVLGQTLVRTLAAVGYTVVPVAYINDLGAHVAACLWAMKNRPEEKMPAKNERVQFLGRMYATAVKTTEENPAIKSELSQIHRELEEGRGDYYKLWKTTRQWSADYLKKVYADFSLPIKSWYFESDLISETKKRIDQMIKAGIAVHSEGAWIVDLEKEGLGVNLLVKTDGTLLYNAKDIALAYRKEEDYAPSRSLYVVDARQSLAMQQLFATLRKMGFKKELAHVAYEFVTLKEGAMSSRKGNIVRYEDFRDAVIELAKAATKERHADWKERKLNQVARTVAFAAIRFAMLRTDLDKQIVFDPKEALAFDGFSGPYLLYTLARMESLLRKAKKLKATAEANEFALPAERRLLLRLAQYPAAVFAAGTEQAIAQLAKYAFELCQTFSEFYEAVPVLKAAGEERAARLAMVEAAKRVLQNVLGLLSITELKEM
jgi:arginyl-tRNA synthetase